MNIARWIGALAVVAGAACTQKANTDGTSTTTTSTTSATSVKPCTVTDSVSGTTVPCFFATGDSVSGSTARSATVSAVVRTGGRAVPLSALTAACRDVSTGAVVSCSLGIVLNSATSTTSSAVPAESVSGTTGRDSTK